MSGLKQQNLHSYPGVILIFPCTICFEYHYLLFVIVRHTFIKVIDSSSTTLNKRKYEIDGTKYRSKSIIAQEL